MRSKQFDFDPANVDDNGIADNLGTGTSWSLAGDAEWLASSSGDSLAHQLVITTVGNEPAGNAPSLTLIGTDADGRVQTDIVVLPNATTVETTKYFLTVTSATADAATVGTMDIGWVDEFASKTIMLDHYSENSIFAQVSLTGTMNFDVEHTAQDVIGHGEGVFAITDQESIVWSNDGNFTGKTASLSSALESGGLHAIRFVCNSYTDTAEVQFFVNHSS